MNNQFIKPKSESESKMREMIFVFLLSASVYASGFILKTYMNARVPHYEEYVMVGD